MKPILILKLGDTFARLAAEHGDFEHLIITRIADPSSAVVVIDPRREPLPEPRQFSGVVLTGSHSMVTERLAWSERTAAWIGDVVGAGVPLLGICYGHQLIAHALGGEVGPATVGKEFGTVEIRLRDAARGDLLFGELPLVFSAHTSHSQYVLRLPPDAVCLASSARDSNSAFRLGEQAWGVQFHPEYDLHTVRTYIGQCAADLTAEGHDPAALLRHTADTPHARALLTRFAAIAAGSR